jgi:ribosomal protein L39E
MSSIKPSGRKIRIAARGKRRSAPRWADIRKFGLKRARSRRISVDGIRNWRRSKLKV